MKKTGQLISLDFLLAMGLIWLTLGIAIKFSEQNAFDWQEEQQAIELENAGKNAVLLLLSSPQLTCEMKTADGTAMGVHLNNCINTEVSHDFNRTALGLPNNFHFYIYNQNTTSVIASTGTPNSDTRAVFSTQIEAIVFNGKIPKAEVYNCLKKKPSCNLNKQTITVQVWK